MTRSPALAAAPPVATKFGALQHVDYRRYVIVALLGMIAENIEHVITYWVIYRTFHSPTLGGFAVISHWVPFLLFSVYAGALADRYDCRKLIQIAQGVYMLVSLLWAVLFLTGTLRVWHAAALLLLHGLGGVLVGPAIQLIVHDIVGAELLASAIRINATSRYLAILLGPAVGGGLMLLFDPGIGLLVNVLIYVPLTVFLARVPFTGHVHDGQARRRPLSFGFGEMQRLLSEARSDPRIFTMIVLGAATSFFVGSAFQVQMPEFAHHLGADDEGAWYSILLAASAAGAVIGAVGLETVAFIRPHARTAIVCAAVWGVLMALFPLAQGYLAAVILLVLAGIFNITFTSMAQALVQLLAPAHVRGAMVGLFNTASLGLRAGSGVTVGVLGGLIGVQWSLALSSCVVVLVSLGLLLVDVRPRTG